MQLAIQLRQDEKILRPDRLCRHQICNMTNNDITWPRHRREKLTVGANFLAIISLIIIFIPSLCVTQVRSSQMVTADHLWMCDPDIESLCLEMDQTDIILISCHGDHYQAGWGLTRPRSKYNSRFAMWLHESMIQPLSRFWLIFQILSHLIVHEGISTAGPLPHPPILQSKPVIFQNLHSIVSVVM